MKQYLAPDKVGVINGLNVKAVETKNLKNGCEYTPCAYCIFGIEKIFDCWIGNKNRPACCISDVENVSNKPLYYVKE